MYDNVRANIQAIIVLWSFTTGHKFVLLFIIVIKCKMLHVN